MDIGPLLKGEDFVAELPFMDAFVSIRFVPREELVAINRKATKRGWDSKHQPTEETDSALANRLLVAAAVKGWRNMGVEFSVDAAVELANKMTEFWRFVNDSCTDFQRIVDAAMEDARKNS